MTFSRTLQGLALALLTPAAALAADLPADARIAYDVLYGDTQMKVGRAEQRWRVEAGRYELHTELVPLLGPRVRYLSRGRLTERGLVPESFAEFRGDSGTPRARAEFDWERLRVRYGRPEEGRSAVLERGAQDVNALAFQLAWLGDKAAGPVQVATGKKVARYSFGGGTRMQVTVNGKRAEAQQWRSQDGEDRTEVWVAAQLGNVPVRVIRVEDDKELRLVARTVQATPAPRTP